MPELPNFGHTITFTIWFELRDKNLGGVMDRNYDVTTFISKYLYFKIYIIANFADIIKIPTIIKKTFKDSKKVKRIRN